MTDTIKRMHLTSTGKDWVTLALDPFHDYEVPIQGKPDQYAGNTVVKLIKKKVTIRAPPVPQEHDVPQTWSVNVCSLPLGVTADARQFEHEFLSSARHIAVGPDALNVGTVVVSSYNDGHHVGGGPNLITAFPQNGISGPHTEDADYATMQSYSYTDDDHSSMSRLIGGGFEIHNDTASLTAQGNVTCYTQPQEVSMPYLVELGSNEVDSDTKIGLGRVFRTPPTTPSEAASLVNSHSWTAKQGCLVPFRLDLNSRDADFTPATTNHAVMRYADHQGSQSSGLVSRSLGHLSYEKVHYATPVGNNRFCGIETSGAFFSGLSPETVLTLDIRFLVEVAPTFANASLVSLASPSAPFDPAALACYAHCVAGLPAGVPVAMNAKGDWWRMVNKVARNIAPVISTINPKVGAIVASTAAASTAVEKAVNSKAGKKSKPNNKFRPNN